MQDYFNTLGVPTDATPEEIHHAYMAGVRHWTPENRQEQLEKVFAYITLRDPQKRAEHLEALKPCTACMDQLLRAILAAVGESPASIIDHFA